MLLGKSFCLTLVDPTKHVSNFESGVLNGNTKSVIQAGL